MISRVTEKVCLLLCSRLTRTCLYSYVLLACYVYVTNIVSVGRMVITVSHVIIVIIERLFNDSAWSVTGFHT